MHQAPVQPVPQVCLPVSLPVSQAGSPVLPVSAAAAALGGTVLQQMETLQAAAGQSSSGS